MRTKCEWRVGLLCVLSWIGGSVACGDDESSDQDPIEERDMAASGRSGTAATSGGAGTTGSPAGSDIGSSAAGGSAAGTSGGAGTTGSPAGADIGSNAAGGGAATSGGAGTTGSPAGADIGSGAPGTSGAPGSANAGVRISDAEVFAVTSAVNAGEIEAGNLASMRARLGPSRDFAQNMVTMHTMVQDRQAALAMSLSLKPAENAVSTMVREQNQAIQAMLMQASDTDFDEVYAQSQVAAHSATLTIMDEVLLPSAMNEMLRADLMATRAAVADHLAMAMELQQQARAGASDGN